MLATIHALGFNAGQIDAIWRCVSAVLLLGQLEYDKASFDGAENNVPGKIANADIVPKICTLLGFKDKDNFTKILLQARVVAGKEIMWKARSLK